MKGQREKPMFHKVSSVRPLPQHRLSVLFANGEMRQYDVAPLLEKWDAFKALESVSGLFGTHLFDTPRC